MLTLLAGSFASDVLSFQWSRTAFHRSKLGKTTSGLSAVDNANGYKLSGDNEWGIPASRSLPPLEEETTPNAALRNGGKVTLLGSGPGDPDLLTVVAFRILSDPNNLVIADRLVSKEILDLIQGEVKIARKLPGCAELAQEEIYWWSYQGLKEGRHVVRLKIGDPFVFGRGGEEVLKFRYFGVEPQVIPVSTIVDVVLRHQHPLDSAPSHKQLIRVSRLLFLRPCLDPSRSLIVGSPIKW